MPVCQDRGRPGDVELEIGLDRLPGLLARALWEVHDERRLVTVRLQRVVETRRDVSDEADVVDRESGASSGSAEVRNPEHERARGADRDSVGLEIQDFACRLFRREGRVEPLRPGGVGIPPRRSGRAAARSAP